MALPKETWDKAKELYEKQGCSFHFIGKSLGIDVSRVNRRAKAERWKPTLSKQAIKDIQMLSTDEVFKNIEPFTGDEGCNELDRLDVFDSLDSCDSLDSIEDDVEEFDEDWGSEAASWPFDTEPPIAQQEPVKESPPVIAPEELPPIGEPTDLQKFLADIRETPLNPTEKATILDRAREVQMELFSTAIVAKRAIENFLIAHPDGKYIKSKSKSGGFINYGITAEALTPFAAILNATANITKEINLTINNNTQINNQSSPSTPAISIEFIGK